MLKRILAFGFVIVGTGAQAFDADAEYDKSYLQVEACFESNPADTEACVIAGIQECANDLEAVLESKGIISPGGAAVDTREYCNSIGLERADEHLNAVYQRIIENEPIHYGGGGAVESLRVAQRLWIQFRNEMCSENTITSWHSGGSGWGAVIDECSTRLSIQQAQNLGKV